MVEPLESPASSPEPVTIWMPLGIRTLFVAAFASVPALFAWIGFEEGEPWSAAAFLSLALAVACRVAMVGVSFTPRGIVIRNLGRTHRLKWTEVTAIVAGKQWTRVGNVGSALVLTDRQAKPGSWGRDSLKSNPYVPMPWVFGRRPPLSIHIAASTGPGRKRKAKLVETLRRFAAVGFYEVDLNVEDLNPLPSDELYRTMPDKPERQRPK
jgi:hypothetical protein